MFQRQWDLQTAFVNLSGICTKTNQESGPYRHNNNSRHGFLGSMVKWLLRIHWMIPIISIIGWYSLTTIIKRIFYANYSFPKIIYFYFYKLNDIFTRISWRIFKLLFKIIFGFKERTSNKRLSKYWEIHNFIVF